MLWDVLTDSLKAVGFTFTAFLSILREKTAGTLQLIERTGNQRSLPGYAVLILGGKKSDDPVSPAYVPTLFKYVRSPAKRKALCQLERCERTGMLKKRRLEAQCKEAASNTLLEASTIMLRDKEVDGLPEQTDSMTCSELEVSEDVTDSCVQSSCSVMTDMTVNSVNDLERECDKLREENLKMKQELKSLKTIDNF